MAALIRALALALWGAVLLRSAADGRLDLLLRAAFHPLVGLAGLGLVAIALAQLLLGWRQRSPRRGLAVATAAAGRRQRQEELRQDWRTALATAVIAALLLAWPPAPSFADLAGQRPADDTVEGSVEESLSFVLPPAQRSLTDWVRLLRSQPDPRLFEGDPVRISGFVLPVPGQPPQLARLLVRCCLADATPVGLPVRWPAAAPLDGGGLGGADPGGGDPGGGGQPREDRWLAIEGQMAVEGERLVVVPQRIRPIPRPARPLEP